MDRWVEALTRPESYRDEPAALEHVQTHLSHVFLGAERVYKLRKPVRFGFVDFSTPALRAADCAREVALNRRLAPSVYLGVARVCVDSGRVEVGPVEDEPDADAPASAEWLVVMRRLPDGEDLQSRLERGQLGRETLDEVAERLAAFHLEQRLGEADWPTADAWQQSVVRPVRGCFDELQRTDFDLPGLRARFEERAAALESVFLARRREGRAVEGHGDLRLEHLWCDHEGRIQVIDCVEFDEALRRIDSASDLAFLSMDLRHRGRPDLAEHLLARHAAHTDDFGLFEVVGFFEAYRALVRAKVADLRARDTDVPAAARRRAEESVASHLALAARVLEPACARLAVLVCGAVGSGKSTAARALAERLPGVVVASDRVRAHVTIAARAGPWGAPGYDDASKDAVYRALLERAERVRAGGRTAVLDASFSRARWRAQAAQWAKRHDLRLALVETVCDAEVVKARVAERQRRGLDASQAGPELVDASRAEFEPLGDWPAADRVRIDTGTDDWRTPLEAFVKRLEG